MKIKLKDILLCLEHVSKSTDAENVDVVLDDGKLEFEYVSKDLKLETVSCYPFEQKRTPENTKIVKLYDKK